MFNKCFLNVIFILLLLLFVSSSFTQTLRHNSSVSLKANYGVPMVPKTMRQFFNWGTGAGMDWQKRIFARNYIAFQFQYQPFGIHLDQILEDIGPIDPIFNDIKVDGGTLRLYQIVMRIRFDMFRLSRLETVYTVYGFGAYGIHKAKSAWKQIKGYEPVQYKADFQAAFGALLGFGWEHQYDQNWISFAEMIYHQMITFQGIALEAIDQKIEDSIEHPGYLEFGAGIRYVF